MTTKEEDILMSENLIKKGVVIDKLLDSLIVTKGVKQEHLILGDKNVRISCMSYSWVMVLSILVRLPIQIILKKSRTYI